MKSRTSFGLLSAALLLALALILAVVGAGCKSGDDSSSTGSGGPSAAGNSGPGGNSAGPGGNSAPGPGGNSAPGPGGNSAGPGNSAPGPGGNSAGPGSSGPGPGGNSAGPGNSAPGPGGPGPGGPPPSSSSAAPAPSSSGGGAASGSATSEEDVKFTFQQAIRKMKLAGVRPLRMKQPNGTVAQGVQFRFQPRGDVEGLMPLLNPGTSSSAGTWSVQMPSIAKAGQKTRGEWENLFCTYVVPDQQALQHAQQTLIARLDQVRAKVYGYGKKAYKIDVEAGDKVPESVKSQVNDTIVTSMPDRLQRAAYYATLASQAIRNSRPDQARLYQSAAMESLGDLAYENGRHADALWIYQQAPKVAQ